MEEPSSTESFIPPKASLFLKVPENTNPSKQKDQSIKKFFKPVEEETFGISQKKASEYEESINSQNEYNKQFAHTSSPQSEGSEIFPHPMQAPKPKIPKRDKLDIRYENAFGEPYTGGNIKQKDYEAMIRDREGIIRMQKQEQDRINKMQRQEQSRINKAQKQKKPKK